MRNSIKHIEKTVIFLLKLGLFVTLFLIFFLLFGIETWSLLNFSRTSGIVSTTFAVLGLSLMSVYGGYAIGKQKSKTIIQSLILATVMTDLVTYVQLSIMNTNDANNQSFTLADPRLLLAVIVLQIVAIIIFVHLGNYIYFKLNPPEKCCVVTASFYSLDKIMPNINKYKNQYDVREVIDVNNKELYDKISDYQTVFLYDAPVDKRYQIVEFCYQHMINIYYNPELSDIVGAASKQTLLDDKPLLFFSNKELSLEQKFFKRAMDIILSLLAIIITSPIMLICAILIKIEDGGTVLYKQQRATINGKIFKVYKFRTMKEHDMSPQTSATSNDDRITKIGNILRKYRVDELPQVMNILKGEMSIVGPRPEMLENIYKYSLDLPEFEYRLRVKAGLTGFAQVVGKYNTSPKDKLILDLLYIEKYSLWGDIKLVFQTLIVFFKSSDSTEAFTPQLPIEFKKSEKEEIKKD